MEVGFVVEVPTGVIVFDDLNVLLSLMIVSDLVDTDLVEAVLDVSVVNDIVTVAGTVVDVPETEPVSQAVSH